MANTFNPPIQPTTEPHYWHWSRPIEQPKFEAPTAPAFADVSKGELLKGVGDLTADAVRGADEIVKEFAGERAENLARDERKQRTAELEGALNVVTGNQNTTQPSLLSEKPPGQRVPEHLDKSIDSMAVFADARAKGTISQTGYWRRVNQGLSDIRSQFPVGYWDYIDQRASAILGTNPANAQLSSMVADINSYITAQNDQAKKVESEAWQAAQKGIPGVTEWLALYRANKIDDLEFMRRLNAATNHHYDAEVSNDNLKIYENNKTMLTQGAIQNFDREAWGDANLYDDLKRAEAGVNDQNAGKIDLDKNSQDVLGQKIALEKAQFLQRQREKANRPNLTFEGKSVSLYQLAPEQVEASIARMAKRWDDKLDLIHNPNYGSFHAYENVAKFAISKENAAIFGGTDPKNEIFRRLHIIRKEFGDDIYQAYLAKIGLGTVTDQMIGADELKRLTSGSNDPQTLDKSFRTFQGSGVTDSAPYRKVLSNTTNIITNDTPPAGVTPQQWLLARQAAMNSVFDKDNADFIGIVNKPSQMGVFTTLTSPAVTDAVTQKGSAKNNRDYQDWMEGSFRSLFRDRILDLNGLGEIPGISIGWDKDNHNIKVEYTPQEPAAAIAGRKTGRLPPTSYRTQEAETAKQVVTELNQGLDGLSHFAKSTNKLDVNKFVLQELFNMGFRPETPLKNFPIELVRAVQASRGQTPEEAAKQEQQLRNKK